MISKQSRRWNQWLGACVLALCLPAPETFAYDLVLTPTNQFHMGEGLAEFDFVYLPNGQSAYAKKLDSTASTPTQYTNSRFTIVPKTGDLGRVEVVDVQVTSTYLGVGAGVGCIAIGSVTPIVSLLEICNNSTTRVVPLKTNVLYTAAVTAQASGYPSEQFVEIRLQVPSEQRAETVSAGVRHTCGLHSDGTVHCWGRNSFGQATPPAGSFTAVSAGSNHTCGVQSDGTLACWGSNNSGQATPPAGTFIAVSAGNEYTCGVHSDGTLACWGMNNYGQATPPAGTFVAVSAGGGFHTCGVHSDGTLACWGYNYFGQATPPAGTFIAVSTGVYYTCGLHSDGTLACWGNNDFGRATPPAGTFIAVSASNVRTCAVHSDGTLACWGSNDFGRATPPAGTFIAVSVGMFHACGVHSDDTLACWGEDYYGQAPQPELLPLTLPPGAIDAGYSQEIRLVDVESALGEFPYAPPTPAFVLTSGALPPGLNLTVVGILSGTPTAAGSFDFTIESEDANRFAAQRNYTLTTVNAEPQDTLAPDTAITAQPSNPSDETSGSFSFSGDDGAGSGIAGFDCSLDGASFGVCSSPHAFTGLALGEHTFSVRARDAAGNSDPSPATVTWTISTAVPQDALAPETTVIAQPSNPSTATSGSISFVGDDGAGSGIAGFACSMDGAPFSACASPYAFVDLTVGAHSFAVRAIDAAGNTDATPATASWTIELALPLPTVGLGAVSVGIANSCGLHPDGKVACWGFNEYGQGSPPPGVFLQVSVGRAHACGLRGDGTLACWGNNTSGRATPPSGQFVQVSAGSDMSCALRSNGTIACWGDIGPYTPPTGTFARLNVGRSHACAVRSNGSLACWGTHTDGQATPPPGTFIQVSAGSDNSCAIKSDGTVVCWGRNDYGQTNPPTGSFVQIESGWYHTCGRRNDGSLICWGYGVDGELNSPAGSFIDVNANYLQSCGLRSTGVMACWGKDDLGQAPQLQLQPATLPAGQANVAFDQSFSLTDSSSYYMTPTPAFAVVAGALPPGLSLSALGQLAGTPTAAGSFAFTVEGEDGNRFIASRSYAVAISQSVNPAPEILSAGLYHTCRIRNDGSLGCWGYNPHGGASPPAGEFMSVSAGYVHSCGLRSDGQLSCWGNNAQGQASAPSGIFVAVSAGNQHSCGVRNDGTLLCWGQSIGSAPAGTFVAVSSRSEFSCAVRRDGTLACWGLSAVQANPPAGAFMALSVSQNHSCAVRSDGTLACWGYDAYGVLSPPAGTFTAVSTGYDHSCAVRTDGTLACWGRNIGSPPTGAFIAVSSGDSHSCATRDNGTLSCWGTDQYGQAPRPTLQPVTLPQGATNVAYAQELRMADVGSALGDFPYVSPTPGFALTSGTLPPGLGLAASGLLSGAPTTAGSFSFTVEGEDANGFTSQRSYTVVSIERPADSTPPVIVPTISGTLGNGGWYTSDATVDWSVSDAESPVTTTTGCTLLTLSADSAGSAYTCTATSAGGTSAGTVTVRRDATAPTLAPNVTPSVIFLNGSGSIAANASDEQSGLASQSCTALDTTTLGTHTSLCTATDVAGNTATATASYQVIDGSLPVITSTISGTLGGDGWYTGDVMINWSVSDAESAITASSGCNAVTLSVDTAGTGFTCTATSAAGTASETVTVKRDASAPVMAPQITPSVIVLTGSGSVAANASDGLSGVATQSCTAVDTTTLGAHTSLCTATDLAGNTATRTVAYDVVDGTPPVIVPTITGSLGDNGWYIGNVAISWSVSDAESVLTATSGCSAVNLATDTASTGIICSATSAGGTASHSVTVKLDKTPPSLRPKVPPVVLLNSTEQASARASDPTSGVATQSCAPLATTTVGSKTVQCTARDRAGNSASASASYRVEYGVAWTTPTYLPTAIWTLPVTRSIPLRWRLVDALGAPVNTLGGATVEAQLAFSCGGFPFQPLLTFGGGNTALKKLGDGVYGLDWRAPSNYRNWCATVGIRLNSGQYLLVDGFHFD